MSYIVDLLEGSQNERKHAFQLQLCNFDADYTPQMCLRMSETLQAQKDFIEQVEIYAAAERLRTGRAVKKGYVRTPIDIKTTKINMKPFLQWFCANDPIPFNFNGRTTVTVKSPAGDNLNVNDMDLDGFFDYTAGGTAFQKRDALDYFENADGVPYDKYDMPNVLFTVNAGAITLGPSTVQNRFLVTKQVRISNTDNLPYPGSLDTANLQFISSTFPVSRTTMADVEMGNLNQRFTFPNFLSGDMLLLKKGKDGTRMPDPTELGRPFASESGNGAELWAKLYGNSYYVPYDETIYFFPPAVKLLVRYDDMVMFFDETENVEELSFNVPIGSYYIKPRSIPLIPDVFRDSVRNTRITASLQNVIDTAPPTPQELLSLPYQKKLKALAYLENLMYTKESYVMAGGYKKTSKPTKRTKIIKHMAKSKKKYHR
jgi:hypothetical protein